MNIEMMVQNLAAEITQGTKAPQGKSPSQEPGEFEAMLREQSKTAQGQKPQQDAEEKTETTTEEKVDPGQKEDGASQKPNGTKDQEVTEAGYQVAAALVTSQPVVHFEFVPQAEPETAPVAVAERTAPEMPVAAAQTSETGAEYLNTVDARPEAQPQAKAEQTQKPVADAEGVAPKAEGEVQVQQPVKEAEGQTQPENNLKQPAGEHQIKVEKGPVESEKGEEKAEPKTFSGEQLGSPVFSGKSVPVKVAEPAAEPVAAEEPDMPQQLANRINTALAQGETKVEIQLNPQNLGKLTVEIIRGADGGLNVVFTATTAKAAALLQQHSSGLQNAMANNTQAPVTVEVQQPQQAEDANNQFLNPDGQNQQNQQHQQQEQKRKAASDDFIQQLRLGLVELRSE